MSTMTLAFLSPATFVSFCYALCSCASVSVREVIPLTEPPASAPQTILVQTFEFEEDMVRVGRQGEELEPYQAGTPATDASNGKAQTPAQLAPQTA